MDSVAWVVLEDGAKMEEDESVVRALMLLARAEEVVPVMAFARARCIFDLGGRDSDDHVNYDGKRVGVKNGKSRVGVPSCAS